MPDAEPWLVSSHQPNAHRVEATVDGEPVWVTSDDLPLDDTPEAWGTAFAFPAARAGAGLRFDSPLDPAWSAGARRNVEVAAGWWGGETHPRWIAPPERATTRVRRRLTRPAAGTALCFTGGVDSFFSLLNGAHRPTWLLYVAGFDVAVDDSDRIDDVVGLVRSVAAERGLAAVIVHTNLRDHPRFASISWEHTHGAALAAVGHLLRASISTLVIPPSYANDRLVPWGSRPDLDSHWSVPRRLTVVHGDASGRRLDRVLAIADDPLVQRHLRVCWQNVGTERNCGRCEKCLRTMAMLAGAGVLDQYPTFAARTDLAPRIQDLATVPTSLIPLWTDLLATNLTEPEHEAVALLVERSSAL